MQSRTSNLVKSSTAERPVKLAEHILALNIGGHNVFFSPKEFILVEMLFNAMWRGEGPVHQDSLINAMYFTEDEPDSAEHVLRVLIYRIRQKLCTTNMEVRNFWGVGYSLIYESDEEWLKQGVKTWRVA